MAKYLKVINVGEPHLGGRKRGVRTVWQAQPAWTYKLSKRLFVSQICPFDQESVQYEDHCSVVDR